METLAGWVNRAILLTVNRVIMFDCRVITQHLSSIIPATGISKVVVRTLPQSLLQSFLETELEVLTL